MSILVELITLQNLAFFELNSNCKILITLISPSKYAMIKCIPSKEGDSKRGVCTT